MEHVHVHVHGTYDPALVIFSYIVAVMASFTVLDLAGKINATKGKVRGLWLFFGAVAMGMGIWSMHFVGMLAFSLPVPVAYDLWLVFVSVLAAIAASFIALYVVGTGSLSLGKLFIGGTLLATGISAMHYIGMGAMLIDITYDPLLFAASIAIALAASYAALWLAFYFRQGQGKRDSWKKAGSGLIMGAAVVGMHYTGMAAARFKHGEKSALASGMVLDQQLLAYVIVAGTILTLGLSLGGIVISNRFARKNSEVKHSEKRYKSLYENTQEGVIFVNMEGKIVEFNPAASAITGMKPSYFYNKPASVLLSIAPEEERDKLAKLFEQAFRGGSFNTETAIVRGDGRRLELSVSNVPIAVDDQAAGTYIMFRDITTEKRAKEQIYHLAYHDELTGLPNRRMFDRLLAQKIDSAKAQQTGFAIMVLDIDRFKLINDSLGHTYGDQLLKDVCGRIQRCMDGFEATLARMGGDEFTLLFDGHRIEQMQELAERIVAALGLPYRLKDNDFYVTASIGIALYPDHGTDAVQLLKNADMAMYEVKNRGKNGFRFFSSELNSQLQSRVEIEADLRKALERKELSLHYQPQIRTEDDAMIGVEALVRWMHPVKGVVSPGQFIPIAEETGMIYEIGTWVLREACRQMKEWHDAGGPLIPVSVNLSSQQFHQPHLTTYIRQILEETRLEPRYLELEITESMMMNPSITIEILNELTEIGVRISLDDFGTGYSSLSYLKQLPIHKVKIDRSFIRDITFNNKDKAIVATIISMAQNLNMEVIAEGIETKDQLDILTANDCRKIQGYYYSRPLAAGDVERDFFLPQRGTTAKPVFRKNT